MPTENNTLTAVAGLRVGHWSHPVGGTGCTVILCPPEGAVAGVDVRGGAPGTRETDLLRPENTVERVHAILLGGGSAFGLAAADGVMQWLEAQGIGYDVGVARVPIVPAAILFDLPVGERGIRPDAAAGYQACENAHDGPVAIGCVGAGVGATVGKALGLAHACKGGLGSAAITTPAGLTVAALVALNAFGDISDPATGAILAAPRLLDATGAFTGFADTVTLLASGAHPAFAATNTTLAVVATNGQLSKTGAHRVAQLSHDGLARTIRPVHTGIDGDVTFALSCGEFPAHPDVVGVLAADVVAAAVLSAVRHAQSLPGMPPAAHDCR